MLSKFKARQIMLLRLSIGEARWYDEIYAVLTIFEGQNPVFYVI